MDPALRAQRRPLQSGPARVLLRGRLPRPGDHAHARLSLVRSGAHGQRAASEPDPPRAAPLQHLHHAHRRARDRLGGDDAAGRHVRRAAALTRTDLHPARAARGARARRSANARQRWTLEQAAEFTSANTPRGWLRLDGNLVRAEQHLYLQQPAYGTSYLIGKMQIEQMHGRPHAVSSATSSPSGDSWTNSTPPD